MNNSRDTVSYTHLDVYKRQCMGTAEQTLIVLAVMAVLFVTEIIPLAITSLGGAITLDVYKRQHYHTALFESQMKMINNYIYFCIVIIIFMNP